LGYLDSPNLYKFVNRNPVNFLDPLGEWFIVAQVHGCAGRNKSEGQAYVQCATLSMYFNSGRELVPGIPARAQGEGRDRTQKNSDTPYGVYLTRDKGWKVFNRVNDKLKAELERLSPNERRNKEREVGEQIGRPGKGANYGLGIINMHSILLEPGGEKVENGKVTPKRDQIRIHGGGIRLENLAESSPFDPFQPLTPTQGCIRVHNKHVLDLITAIDYLSKNAKDLGEMEDGVIVVGGRDYFKQLLHDSTLDKRWEEHEVTRNTGLQLETLRRVLEHMKWPSEGL
jgi:hypothetical protein